MTPRRLLLVLFAASVATSSCKGCKACDKASVAREDDDEAEEQEERERTRDHYWRAQIRIVGKGTVATFVDAFACTSDGSTQTGVCGPKLVTFKELSPPTMKATGAPGWELDHWESSILEPDGAVTTRQGKMPDGTVYLNGFGYRDTGQLETVTAVFVRVDGGG